MAADTKITEIWSSANDAERWIGAQRIQKAAALAGVLARQCDGRGAPLAAVMYAAHGGQPTGEAALQKALRFSALVTRDEPVAFFNPRGYQLVAFGRPALMGDGEQPGFLHRVLLEPYKGQRLTDYSLKLLLPVDPLFSLNEHTHYVTGTQANAEVTIFSSKVSLGEEAARVNTQWDAEPPDVEGLSPPGMRVLFGFADIMAAVKRNTPTAAHYIDDYRANFAAEL